MAEKTPQDILRLVQLFDEWLAEASDEQVRQNCREQGAKFFKFIQGHGIHPGWAAKLIIDVTGHHPRALYQSANMQTTRDALANYYYSISGVEYEEANSGRQLNWYQTQQVVKQIWRG